jgi:hypothetical protein
MNLESMTCRAPEILEAVKERVGGVADILPASQNRAGSNEAKVIDKGNKR